MYVFSCSKDTPTLLHVRDEFDGPARVIDMVKPKGITIDELLRRVEASRTAEPMAVMSDAIMAQLGPNCWLADAVDADFRQQVFPQGVPCKGTPEETGAKLADAFWRMEFEIRTEYFIRSPRYGLFIAHEF